MIKTKKSSDGLVVTIPLSVLIDLFGSETFEEFLRKVDDVCGDILAAGKELLEDTEKEAIDYYDRV